MAPHAPRPPIEAPSDAISAAGMVRDIAKPSYQRIFFASAGGFEPGSDADGAPGEPEPVGTPAPAAFGVDADMRVPFAGWERPAGVPGGGPRGGGIGAGIGCAVDGPVIDLSFRSRQELFFVHSTNETCLSCSSRSIDRSKLLMKSEGTSHAD